jgi:hypothetical protein
MTTETRMADKVLVFHGSCLAERTGISLADDIGREVMGR